MSEKFTPTRCSLCDTGDRIVSARFRQVYSQKDSKPVLLDWWECGACGGLFVHPIPPIEVVNRHLASVDYNDESFVSDIAKAKEQLQRRILKGLSCWTRPGELLDFGCNFGQFLVLAREAGWEPYGFEPYLPAAEAARSRGFKVWSQWSFEESDFVEGSFSAIAAVDVLSLVWDPIKTLRTFSQLLKPGGMLVMRLTNKRFVLEIVRAISRPGPARDHSVSNILLGQFHSIGIESLKRVLRGVGFDRINVQTNALTAPWHHLRWQTRLAYAGSEVLYRLSRINLSPGVLLFAQRSRQFTSQEHVADFQQVQGDRRFPPICRGQTPKIQDFT